MRRTSVVGIVALLVVAGLVMGCGKKIREQRQAAKEFQQAMKQIAANQQANAEQLSKAAAAMQKAAAENKPVAEPVDFRELKALLPESLSGMKRTSAEGSKDGAAGMSVATAKGRYEAEGDKSGSLDVQITDMGAMAGVAAMAQYAWTVHEVDRETDTGYEKTTTIDGHKALEKYDREGKWGEIQCLVKGRFNVELRGNDVDMDTIKGALKTIDLAKLESLTK